MCRTLTSISEIVGGASATPARWARDGGCVHEGLDRCAMTPGPAARRRHDVERDHRRPEAGRRRRGRSSGIVQSQRRAARTRPGRACSDHRIVERERQSAPGCRRHQRIHNHHVGYAGRQSAPGRRRRRARADHRFHRGQRIGRAARRARSPASTAVTGACARRPRGRARAHHGLDRRDRGRARNRGGGARATTASTAVTGACARKPPSSNGY